MANGIYCDDCLEAMPRIETGSIDMVLADPPYGMTKCGWDVVIPIDPMWEQLKRVIKPTGAVLLFGAEPFASALRLSNSKMYKYDWVWEKTAATGFLNAKKQPLRNYETISVFYAQQPTYNPQMTPGKPYFGKVGNHQIIVEEGETVYGTFKRRYEGSNDSGNRYPKQVIKFKRETQKSKDKKLHQTPKPVALLEYLIKTYTNPGETILDFCMGSGSTCIAAQNIGRNCIGIEKDESIYATASTRINRYLANSEIMAGVQEVRQP